MEKETGKENMGKTYAITAIGAIIAVAVGIIALVLVIALGGFDTGNMMLGWVFCILCGVLSGVAGYVSIKILRKKKK